MKLGSDLRYCDSLISLEYHRIVGLTLIVNDPDRSPIVQLEVERLTLSLDLHQNVLSAKKSRGREWQRPLLYRRCGSERNLTNIKRGGPFLSVKNPSPS